MFELSEKQAQEIVDKMMMDIPYNINIMNGKGVIIGSGKKERVGTIHQGQSKHCPPEKWSRSGRMDVMKKGHQ